MDGKLAACVTRRAEVDVADVDDVDDDNDASFLRDNARPSDDFSCAATITATFTQRRI